MKTYARIDNPNPEDPAQEIVVEIIRPMVDVDGNEIPIGDRFHPDFVKTLVDVTSTEPTPQVGWIYAGGVFAPPA